MLDLIHLQLFPRHHNLSYIELSRHLKIGSMHSFLELHAQTFYTNFSSTDNFVQWKYLYCANNVFSYCDQNLLSDEKVQALRFLITFFAATTIIFKTILLNNVVFHVLYFDFVVT